MSITSVTPILAMIAGIILSLSLDFPIAWGIVFAILVTLVSVKRLGYPWKQQFVFGWEGVQKAKPVLTILFLVGLLIPLLMMGGTIPAIIYYGLSIVNVEYLFVLSFLLTAGVSYLLGTSIGTLIGINGNLDVKTFFTSMLFGFELHSGTPLDQLVHGGGMFAIFSVLVLIILAGFLNGILNRANLLTPIVDKMMGHTKNKTVLVAKAAALSLLVVIISCNQTIPILVLGSTLLGRFSQWEGGRELLGKTMLDSTVVMPVLIPWNGLSMMMALTLSVSTLQTLPFVFFPILLPIVTILSTRWFSPEGRFLAMKNKAS